MNPSKTIEISHKTSSSYFRVNVLMIYKLTSHDFFLSIHLFIRPLFVFMSGSDWSVATMMEYPVMRPLRWLNGSTNVIVILSDETSSSLAFASDVGSCISGAETIQQYDACKRK